MTVPSAQRDEIRWRKAMIRSLGGDAAAYRGLLGELYDVVAGYLRRMLGDSPAVEDCVQECLETLHRNRHTYDPSRPFRPWFFTIVRHKAIDVLRRDRGRIKVPLTEQEPGIPSNPDHRLDAECLLAKLDPMYRDPIVLTKLQGYSTNEAAEAIGVTGAALRTRVHRGLRELASMLEREASL